MLTKTHEDLRRVGIINFNDNLNSPYRILFYRNIQGFKLNNYICPVCEYTCEVGPNQITHVLTDSGEMPINKQIITLYVYNARFCDPNYNFGYLCNKINLDNFACPIGVFRYEVKSHGIPQ